MTVKRIWHKIKAFPLIGVPYQWLIGKRKVEYEMKKQNQALNDNGLQYINTVEKIMQKTNAIYYVYAGTLLGIVRDRALIKWDLDIDYGVVIDETFSWEDLQRTMKSAGYRKVREFIFEGNITEQTYQIGNMKVDFFGQFPLDDKMRVYSYNRFDDVKYPDLDTLSVYEETHPKVISLKKTEINGVTVTIPENAEALLESIYTESWRIPNPEWKSNSGQSTKLLDGKFGYMR